MHRCGRLLTHGVRRTVPLMIFPAGRRSVCHRASIVRGSIRASHFADEPMSAIECVARVRRDSGGSCAAPSARGKPESGVAGCGLSHDLAVQLSLTVLPSREDGRGVEERQYDHEIV